MIARKKDYLFPILVLLLCLLTPTKVRGQEKSEQEKYQVDSTLYVYYQHCKTEVKSPSALQMLDTLFLMAEEKGDKRMQAVALSTKVDHFYFAPPFATQEDSLIYYINRVKDFARKTNQPQYYYFAWADRLITFYTKQKKLNLALYEANKMQKESEEREEIDGMMYCYQALFRIYEAKDLNSQAVIYIRKQIDLILKYNLNQYNLSRKYFALSNCYLQTGEPEKALEALEESKPYIFNEIQQGLYLCAMVRYYNNIKDLPKARQTLEELRKLFEENMELKTKYIANLEEAATNYYIMTGEYDKALASYQKTIRLFEQSGLMSASTYRQLGNIYNGKRDYPKAIKNYQRAFELSDSLNSAHEGVSVGEFATILGMEHLNLENKELIQKNQEIQLENRQRLIILLCVIAAGIAFMFFRELRLNKILRRAKEAEESASRMKTEFIQNMSHEIRTPLNSIVGFSQILSSNISEQDEESKEFVSIIEQGSNHLLQLVDNVLELADLDSGTSIPADTEVEINSLFRKCMEQAKDLIQPDVALSFQPEREEFILRTNPGRLCLVLSHLLQNAARFTEKGSIILSWQTDLKINQLTICITDTGIGIPPDKQEFVFERFAKVDTFSKGTGLGLSLARLSMQRMGGSLVLDNHYEDGCRFILTLPIQ